LFGGNIAVTGLLAGADVAAVLDAEPAGAAVRYLLPDVTLSRGVFLDGAAPMSPSPDGRATVAVVGRPNVGKSTLVNRIVGRREAIVEERPGVTRDRKVLDAEWIGRPFSVVDTGGWIRSDEPLARQVSLQAERAIDEADVVVLVV